MARASPAPVSTSPRMSCTALASARASPGGDAPAMRAGSRPSASTSCPSQRSRGISSEPAKPEAPVTSTRMCADDDVVDCEPGQVAQKATQNARLSQDRDEPAGIYG